MTDKNLLITNLCSSEPHTGSVDVIWSSTGFHQESCLPDIGSCQVSSILSTLEHSTPKTILEPKLTHELQNINLQTDTFKSIPINIINSASVPSIEEVKKRKRNNKNDDVLENKHLFQEMVYFGCNLCPFICTKDNKITDHITSVHKNKNHKLKRQLKCPGCPNIFYHKLSLRSHLIHDHEVGRSDINKIVNSIFYVSILSENNNSNIDSEENVTDETKNEENSFQCDEIAEENMELENNSEDLESIDFLEKPLDLEEQNDYLPKEESLQNIEVQESAKTEDIKRAQKCCVSTCAVRMTNVVNMAYHVKCHFGKIFRCLECNEANFVVWKTLQTHLWRAHNIDMELYACDKCGYKTYSLAKLNNIHKLIHGNERPFLCDLCGKGFKNTKQLRNHKIIHKAKNVNERLQCTVCERTFTDKRLLKVHLTSVHQKLKPFSCNYCGYKAASNATLKLHIRQHTGEKPFVCDICDYSTADHNSLRRHKSRHSGEKKYKCIHCDYACIQSSTYKAHLKTKHPGLENEHMFSCPYCQFRSVNKDKYTIHIASHKEKKKQKIIDIIENICETEGLEERVVEIVSLNNKKPDIEVRLQQQSSLDNHLETPVALISKINIANSNFILPQNENILNLTNISTDNNVLQAAATTTISTNGVQYFYNGSNVLLEIVDEKTK